MAGGSIQVFFRRSIALAGALVLLCAGARTGSCGPRAFEIRRLKIGAQDPTVAGRFPAVDENIFEPAVVTDDDLNCVRTVQARNMVQLELVFKEDSLPKIKRFFDESVARQISIITDGRILRTAVVHGGMSTNVMALSGSGDLETENIKDALVGRGRVRACPASPVNTPLPVQVAGFETAGRMEVRHGRTNVEMGGPAFLLHNGKRFRIVILEHPKFVLTGEWSQGEQSVTTEYLEGGTSFRLTGIANEQVGAHFYGTRSLGGTADVQLNIMDFKIVSPCTEEGRKLLAEELPATFFDQSATAFERDNPENYGLFAILSTRCRQPLAQPLADCYRSAQGSLDLIAKCGNAWKAGGTP